MSALPTATRRESGDQGDQGLVITVDPVGGDAYQIGVEVVPGVVEVEVAVPRLRPAVR
jgi:hypothetical protein